MTLQTLTRDFPLNSNPPYLTRTEPPEAEEIPLQLALITMEVASQREALNLLAQALERLASQKEETAAFLEEIARAIRPPAPRHDF